MSDRWKNHQFGGVPVAGIATLLLLLRWFTVAIAAPMLNRFSGGPARP